MGWLSNLFSSSSNETPTKAKTLLETTLANQGANEESASGTQTYGNHEHINQIKSLIREIDTRFRVNSEDSYEKGREALSLKIDAIKDWLPSMTVDEVLWHCNGGVDMKVLWDQIGQTDEWDYYLEESDIESELNERGLACSDYPEPDEKRKKKNEAERLEREKDERRKQKWDELKPEFSRMTVDEIATRLGESNGYVKVRLLNMKLAASDYDATDLDFTAIRAYGEKVAALICPHCQTKGNVRRKKVQRTEKTRVNSLLGAAAGIGTNTTREVTQMYCENCQTKWDI